MHVTHVDIYLQGSHSRVKLPHLGTDSWLVKRRLCRGGIRPQEENDTLCHADVLLQSLVESLWLYTAVGKSSIAATNPLSPPAFQLPVAAAG